MSTGVVTYLSVGPDGSVILSSTPLVNKKRSGRFRSFLSLSLLRRKKKNAENIDAEVGNIDVDVHNDKMNDDKTVQEVDDLSQYGFETADTEKPYTVLVTHPDQYDPSPTHTPREERVRTRLTIPSFYKIPRTTSDVTSFGFEASNVDDPDISILLTHPTYNSTKKKQQFKRWSNVAARVHVPDVELVDVPGRRKREKDGEEGKVRWDTEPAEARELVARDQEDQVIVQVVEERETPEEEESLVSDNKFFFDQLIDEFDLVLAPKLVRAIMCEPEIDDVNGVTTGRREKNRRRHKNAGHLDDVSLTTFDETLFSDDTSIATFVLTMKTYE